jgi:hypothetical protein
MRSGEPGNTREDLRQERDDSIEYPKVRLVTVSISTRVIAAEVNYVKS